MLYRSKRNATGNIGVNTGLCHHRIRLQAEHSFADAKRLPVDFLLGGHFLTLHSVVLDCANHHLSLGDNTRHQISLCGPKPTQGYAFVVVPEQLEIPAQTIQLVKAKTDASHATLAGTQGLIESIEMWETKTIECNSRLELHFS